MNIGWHHHDCFLFFLLGFHVFIASSLAKTYSFVREKPKTRYFTFKLLFSVHLVKRFCFLLVFFCSLSFSLCLLALAFDWLLLVVCCLLVSCSCCFFLLLLVYKMGVAVLPWILFSFLTLSLCISLYNHITLTLWKHLKLPPTFTNLLWNSATNIKWWACIDEAFGNVSIMLKTGIYLSMKQQKFVLDLMQICIWTLVRWSQMMWNQFHCWIYTYTQCWCVVFLCLCIKSVYMPGCLGLCNLLSLMYLYFFSLTLLLCVECVLDVVAGILVGWHRVWSSEEIGSRGRRGINKNGTPRSIHQSSHAWR